MLLRETGSLGLRGTVLRRWPQHRTERQVIIDGHTMRAKVALGRVKVEYDDAAAAAAALGRPLRDVLGRGARAGRTRRPVIPPFVDAEFVASHPEAVLADVRWYLDGRDGRAAFEAGHIPGARVGRPRPPARRPRSTGHRGPPSVAHARRASPQAMGSLGIANDTLVVAYDDTGGLTAGRLAVMLRMIGCDAAVLVGGLDGVDRRASRPAPARTPTPVEFTAGEWPSDRLAAADEVEQIVAAGGTAIDARSHERFTRRGRRRSTSAPATSPARAARRGRRCSTATARSRSRPTSCAITTRHSASTTSTKSSPTADRVSARA